MIKNKHINTKRALNKQSITTDTFFLPAKAIAQNSMINQCAENFNYKIKNKIKRCCNMFDQLKWKLYVIQIENLPCSQKKIDYNLALYT